VALSEFWQMTPWHLSVMCEEYSKKTESEQSSRIGVAWYVAAFSRLKKLPTLKEVLHPVKSQSKSIDEGAILFSLQQYQKQRDERKHGERS
jgi:hypothetical protein